MAVLALLRFGGVGSTATGNGILICHVLGKQRLRWDRRGIGQNVPEIRVLPLILSNNARVVQFGEEVVPRKCC